MRDRELGHKLGPRLVDLMVQATLASRRGLAPHEAKVHAAGVQIAIDRMGHELADHYRPFIVPLLDGTHPPLHPDLHEYLETAAAGTDQWRSAGTFLFGTVQSALSTVINNAVAPVAYALTRPSPNIRLDPVTVANLLARGLQDWNSAVGDAASQGIDSDKLGQMMELARVPPDPSVIVQLLNRGLITEAEAEEWMARLAIPVALRVPLVALRRELLTPADAALAVLRGNMSEAEGQAIAAASGLHVEDFQTLVANTGEPPGLEQLQEYFRRRIIDEAEFTRGVRQSRVRDEWIPALLKGRYVPMSTADAADAALRGHLTPEAAQQIAEENGLRPGDWPAFWANQGNPPSDFQLLELHRRGFINRERLVEGLRQGRLRDDWIPAIEDLSTTRLPNADAIDAWLRGHLSREAAEDLLGFNGLDSADWAAAFGNAGNPLPLEQLLEAFRRGFIDRDRFVQGFRESRYRDEWAGTALELRYHPMTTADAIQAAVQGHISVERASDIAEQNGLLPEDFQAAYQTAGSPLSRTELEELFNRGLITRTTVEAGLRESRLKDKYIPAALELHVKIPSEPQILRGMAAGVLTHPDGSRLLMDLGYAPETVEWIVAEAEVTGNARHRELALGQVAALYEARMIERPRAEELLKALRYTPASVELLLALADHTRHQRILNTGITSVRHQYLAHRITILDATSDLAKLGVPSPAIEDYVLVWEMERRGQVRQLTEAQIVKAHKLALFDKADAAANDAEALKRLEELGYDEADAQLLLDGA